MFSCEFCEISKSIFLTECLSATASAFLGAFAGDIFLEGGLCVVFSCGGGGGGGGGLGIGLCLHAVLRFPWYVDLNLKSFGNSEGSSYQKFLIVDINCALLVVNGTCTNTS